jgi:FdrA protein
MSPQIVINQVRRGFYLDSVALMRISVEIAALPGVDGASLMIGSDSNKRILDEAGLLAEPGHSAGPDDLIIALRAPDQDAADRGLAAVAAALARAPKTARGLGEWRPRTLDAAVATLPAAKLVLISVPGEFAASEAMKALRRGLHVMIFSDNVPIAQERALKQTAKARGLLVMGPDCGTALLAGIPLGFANEVARGSIGAVAASGTGLQEFSVLVAGGGGGLSHGIGVGGRDLSDDIGGITTLMAIDALEEDPETNRIVLISKPPGPATARTVLARLAQCRKPVTVCFLGLESDVDLPAQLGRAHTIKAAAESALGRRYNREQSAAMRQAKEAAAALSAERRWIYGLYTGGSLCAEAQVLVRAADLSFQSNAPIPGARALEEHPGAIHTLLDLGADEYTIGRPHPMIEPAVCTDVLAQTLRRPDVAVVLLDVVLGYGAHADPAGAVAQTIAHSETSHPVIVASVCGTDADPQNYSQQVRKLEQVGVIVAASNAEAAELAVRIVQSRP